MLQMAAFETTLSISAGSTLDYEHYKRHLAVSSGATRFRHGVANEGVIGISEKVGNTVLLHSGIKSQLKSS